MTPEKVKLYLCYVNLVENQSMKIKFIYSRTAKGNLNLQRCLFFVVCLRDFFGPIISHKPENTIYTLSVNDINV